MSKALELDREELSHLSKRVALQEDTVKLLKSMITDQADLVAELVELLDDPEQMKNLKVVN